jgi:hypothetical protein
MLFNAISTDFTNGTVLLNVNDLPFSQFSIFVAKIMFDLLGQVFSRGSRLLLSLTNRNIRPFGWKLFRISFEIDVET